MCKWVVEEQADPAIREAIAENEVVLEAVAG
jgi:hypothetical protein